jgi:hypothetical protein
MIQPGPDEISQGMDRRRSSVAEKLIGALLSDLSDYAVARSVVQYQDTLVAPSGSFAGMASTFTAVRGDLRALNRRCGQPPGAYEGDSF